MPTNRVDSLDPALFVPGVIISGVLLLKREPRASTLAPAFSVFLRLTWVPILLAPVVQDVRGQTADLGLAIPIGTLAAALAAPVMRHMAGLRAAE